MTSLFPSYAKITKDMSLQSKPVFIGAPCMYTIFKNSVKISRRIHTIHTHTHTRLTALFPGLPGWAGTKKVKPIWILLKQETLSGSGISWAYASLHLAPDR